MYRKHDQLDRAQISPQDIEKMARFMKECYKDGTCEKVARILEKRMRITSDTLFED